VQIAPEQRTHDFYLYEPTADYYWSSEYLYKGHPAKFRCAFLIHLEPADAGGSATDSSAKTADAKVAATKVEIVEAQPMVWAGEYLGFSAHAVLPTMLHDSRPVEETTSEREALLEVISHPRPVGSGN
jgi:hypothetical protein